MVDLDNSSIAITSADLILIKLFKSKPIIRLDRLNVYLKLTLAKFKNVPDLYSFEE